MLRSISDQICSELRECGASPVYSAFDAVPVSNKSKGIYTIVGIESFSSSKPVNSPYIVYIPFRAEVSIKVTAPPDCPLERLYDYYSSTVSKAIAEMTGLCCGLEKLTVKYDSNINRLMLIALFEAQGITRAERSIE